MQARWTLRSHRLITLVIVLSFLLAGLPLGVQPALALGGGSGSISLTTLGVAYTQNFDTLANTLTTNDLTINGWYLDETGSSSRNNGQYAASTGSDNAGDVFSFGASGSAERAFGTLYSGTLSPKIGALFTNDTGQTIASLLISYTGEMWRAGVANRGAADRLDFQYSLDAASLNSGAWTHVDELDFNSPNLSAAAGALAGNSPGNQAPVSFTIAGLNIAPGASFWIRWTDWDIAPGADDGLSVDDFSLTPGSGPDAAPEVAATYPVDGAADFPINANLSVTFSEPVYVLDPWFDLSCTVSGPAIPTAYSGGPATFTLDPALSLVHGESCTLTILAGAVTDQDGNDPPDNMALDFIVGFQPFDVCQAPYTPIYQIQGSGLSAAITGNVTTMGVVVGDFEGTAATSGFFLQDLSGDGDPATSDGIFVYTANNDFVSPGQVVRVSGYARERFNLTTLNGSNSNNSPVAPNNVIICGAGSVAPTDVFLPFASADEPERFEGMLVRLPQAMTIAEYFNYDRFGEVVLALPLDGEARAYTPTAIDEPGAPALARAQANLLRRITLDDAQSASNPPNLRHPDGGQFTLGHTFRGGDLLQNTVGVLTYDFSLYRIVPTGPADYYATNPRPAAPDPVGGSLRVSAMNTLNYFLTPDYASGSLDNKCGPFQNVECRGWDFDQPDELNRQRAKLLAVIAAVDPDILGLNEMENTTGVEPLADIVAGLNAMGYGPYAYIDTGTIGTDAIKVGLIYKPARVTPFGSYAILDSTVDPRFLDTKSRPALAQTFDEVGSGARLTVAVNHLKSKGSDCNDVGDYDLGDGQGNCNLTRKAAAEALVDWLASDPTASGDADFLILGDLNSYAREDPISAILAGPDDVPGTADDYVNLILNYQGTYAYSYVFDGQAGYLDHALASPSLAAQVSGATEWHVNADEPDVLDYDTSFKPPAQDDLYEPLAYRSSDHDPVVVGVNLLGYTWDGFFQPVDNLPVLNQVKAGSAVPVKFSLGGDMGLDIFMPGYPASVPVACEAGGVIAPIEQTVPAGGSSLAYDPVSGQYNYVWKTEKGWSGSCRMLIVALRDGTTHYALFKMR